MLINTTATVIIGVESDMNAIKENLASHRRRGLLPNINAMINNIAQSRTKLPML